MSSADMKPDDPSAPTPAVDAAAGPTTPAPETPDAETTPAPAPDRVGVESGSVGVASTSAPIVSAEDDAADDDASGDPGAEADSDEDPGDDLGEDAGEADDGDAEAAGPGAPTADEIARITDLFTRAEVEGGQLAGFHFARWTRPLCPAVFGCDDAGADAIVSGVAEAARIAGLEVRDEDPEFGANLLFFFCSDWSELKDVPSLDRLIPDLDKLVVLLSAAGANQYRIFSFGSDVGLRLALVLIRYDEDLQRLSPPVLALGQAVQTLLLWSDNAFTRENPVDLGRPRGARGGRDRRPRVTRWFAALLKAAYADDAPAYSNDPALAEALAARAAAELDRSERRGGRRGKGARAAEKSDAEGEAAPASDTSTAAETPETGSPETDAPETDAPAAEAPPAESAGDASPDPGPAAAPSQPESDPSTPSDPTEPKT